MFRTRVTVLSVMLFAGLTAGVAQAQTVDEVVAKNLAARGGVEKLKALNSAKITGDVVQQGAKIHIVTYAKRPNMMRREMDAAVPPGMPAGPSGKPADGRVKQIVAFDGANVWVMNSLMGPTPQAVTGPQADMAKQDADFDSVLLDYKEKGHKVQLVGTETIDGKKAYHLKITKKLGFVQDYYLDADTGLELRTSSTVDQNGQPVEIRTDLSNYQMVDGLSMPFTMTQSVNGKPVAEVTITKWEVNVPLQDDLFKMPEKD